MFDLGIWILAVMAVGLLLQIFLTFDQLIRRQYSNHRDAWEQDRRPNGFFWKAPGRFFSLGASFAQHRASLRLVFRTPEWIRSDAEAAALQRRFRWLVLAWNLGIVLAVPLVFLMAQR